MSLNKLVYIKVVQLFLVLFSMLDSFSIIHAQDTTNAKDGSFSFEGQIYPQWNNDGYQPQFKIRWNINSSSALRLNTSFNRSVDYYEVFELGGAGVGSVEKINSFYSFGFGYEGIRSFDRTSLYSGIEGFVGLGKEDVYGSRTDSISFVSDLNYNVKRPLQHLGVRVFTGVDYNITTHLYIGSEVGLMLLKTTRKTGSYQVLDASSLTSPDVTTSIASSSNSDLSFSGLGCIRIGWRF